MLVSHVYTELLAWRCSDTYAGTRFVKNVLPNPWVLWVLGKDVVADVYGIHKPPGFHVVKGKLVTCGGKGGRNNYILRVTWRLLN